MPKVLRRNSLLSKDTNSQTLEWRLEVWRLRQQPGLMDPEPRALGLDLRRRGIQRKSKRAGGGNVIHDV